MVSTAARVEVSARTMPPLRLTGAAQVKIPVAPAATTVSVSVATASTVKNDDDDKTLPVPPPRSDFGRAGRGVVVAGTRKNTPLFARRRPAATHIPWDAKQYALEPWKLVSTDELGTLDDSSDDPVYGGIVRFVPALMQQLGVDVPRSNEQAALGEWTNASKKQGGLIDKLEAQMRETFCELFFGSNWRVLQEQIAQSMETSQDKVTSEFYASVLKKKQRFPTLESGLGRVLEYEAARVLPAYRRTALTNVFVRGQFTLNIQISQLGYAIPLTAANTKPSNALINDSRAYNQGVAGGLTVDGTSSVKWEDALRERVHYVFFYYRRASDVNAILNRGILQRLFGEEFDDAGMRVPDPKTINKVEQVQEDTRTEAGLREIKERFEAESRAFSASLKQAQKAAKAAQEAERQQVRSEQLEAKAELDAKKAKTNLKLNEEELASAELQTLLEAYRLSVTAQTLASRGKSAEGSEEAAKQAVVDIEAQIKEKRAELAVVRQEVANSSASEYAASADAYKKRRLEMLVQDTDMYNRRLTLEARAMAMRVRMEEFGAEMRELVEEFEEAEKQEMNVWDERQSEWMALAARAQECRERQKPPYEPMSLAFFYDESKTFRTVGGKGELFEGMKLKYKQRNRAPDWLGAASAMATVVSNTWTQAASGGASSSGSGDTSASVFSSFAAKQRSRVDRDQHTESIAKMERAIVLLTQQLANPSPPPALAARMPAIANELAATNKKLGIMKEQMELRTAAVGACRAYVESHVRTYEPPVNLKAGETMAEHVDMKAEGLAFDWNDFYSPEELVDVRKAGYQVDVMQRRTGERDEDGRLTFLSDHFNPHPDGELPSDYFDQQLVTQFQDVVPEADDVSDVDFAAYWVAERPDDGRTNAAYWEAFVRGIKRRTPVMPPEEVLLEEAQGYARAELHTKLRREGKLFVRDEYEEDMASAYDKRVAFSVDDRVLDSILARSRILRVLRTKLDGDVDNARLIAEMGQLTREKMQEWDLLDEWSVEQMATNKWQWNSLDPVMIDVLTAEEVSEQDIALLIPDAKLREKYTFLFERTTDESGGDSMELLELLRARIDKRTWDAAPVTDLAVASALDQSRHPEDVAEMVSTLRKRGMSETISNKELLRQTFAGRVNKGTQEGVERFTADTKTSKLNDFLDTMKETDVDDWRVNVWMKNPVDPRYARAKGFEYNSDMVEAQLKKKFAELYKYAPESTVRWTAVFNIAKSMMLNEQHAISQEHQEDAAWKSYVNPRYEGMPTAQITALMEADATRAEEAKRIARDAREKAARNAIVEDEEMEDLDAYYENEYEDVPDMLEKENPQATEALRQQNREMNRAIPEEAMREGLRLPMKRRAAAAPARNSSSSSGDGSSSRSERSEEDVSSKLQLAQRVRELQERLDGLTAGSSLAPLPWFQR